MADIDGVPALAREIFSAQFDHVKTEIGDDDCAIIESRVGSLVLTTDLMNHRPALMTLDLPDRYYNYGYLMASANLSDLYGTGAKPVAVLVGLMVPEELDSGDVSRVLRGIADCCAVNNVPVVGGDTKRSDKLQGYAVGIGHIDATATALTRVAATPGQRLMVSGPLGDFNAATFLLTNGHCPEDLLEEAHRAITRPRLRGEMALALSARNLATGGIDISDGLGMDLWRLAAASRVGLRVDAGSITVGQLARKTADLNGVDPLSFVFSTGGDWQFAFTCDERDVAACEDLGGNSIGEVMATDGCELDLGTHVLELPRFGHSDNRGVDFGTEVRLGIERFAKLKSRQ